MYDEYRIANPEFSALPEQSPPAPEIFPVPPEFDPPGAESAPLPEEYGQTPRMTAQPQDRRHTMRRLLICSLAAVAIASPLLTGSAEKAADTDSAAPGGDAAAELAELIRDIPVVDNIIEVIEDTGDIEYTEDRTDQTLTDVFEGMTDAEVLVAYSPWQAENISVTFLENGLGFWTGGVRCGSMTWNENEDGLVHYDGFSVIYKASLSTSEGSASSGGDMELYDEISTIYYADTARCSGTVGLDRGQGTAELDNPIGAREILYTAGSGDINTELALLIGIPPETLRSGSWEPSDEVEAGVSSLTLHPDGTAELVVNGQPVTANADLAGTNGEAWIHLFNTEDGNFRINMGADSYMEVSNGMNLIIGIRDGVPILTFYDFSADSFAFRVFTRPDLPALLHPEAAAGVE